MEDCDPVCPRNACGLPPNRSHAVEIDVRIAPLGHPREVGVDTLPRFIHLAQQGERGILVAIAAHGDQLRRIVEQHARLCLDRDVDQHEPVLVRTAEEVLVHRDIVERDRAGLVEPVPVVEHVARIGQQRCLAEPVGQRDHRAGEIGGKVRGGIILAPHVGLHQEGIVHHRGANLFLGRVLGPFVDLRIGQRVQPVAYSAGGQQGGKIACGLHNRIEL